MLLESCLQSYFDDNDDNEFMIKHGNDESFNWSKDTQVKTKNCVIRHLGSQKQNYVIEIILQSELAIEFLVAWDLVGFIHFLSYYMVGSSHSVKHLDPVVIVMNIEFHDLVGAIYLVVFEY